MQGVLPSGRDIKADICILGGIFFLSFIKPNKSQGIWIEVSYLRSDSDESIVM